MTQESQLAAKHQLIYRVSWLRWVFWQNTKHSMSPLQFWLDFFAPLQSTLFKFFSIKQNFLQRASLEANKLERCQIYLQNLQPFAKEKKKRAVLSRESAAEPPSLIPANKSWQVHSGRLEGKCLNQISGHIENYNSKSLHSLGHRNKPEANTDLRKA